MVKALLESVTESAAEMGLNVLGERLTEKNGDSKGGAARACGGCEGPLFEAGGRALAALAMLTGITRRNSGGNRCLIEAVEHGNLSRVEDLLKVFRVHCRLGPDMPGKLQS